MAQLKSSSTGSNPNREIKKKILNKNGFSKPFVGNNSICGSHSTIFSASESVYDGDIPLVRLVGLHDR